MYEIQVREVEKEPKDVIPRGARQKNSKGLPAEDVQEQRDGARSMSNGKWMLSASHVIMAQSRTDHDARALRPCKLLPLLGSVAFKVLRFTKLRLPS
jgi:hypothetical protein